MIIMIVKLFSRINRKLGLKTSIKLQSWMRDGCYYETFSLVSQIALRIFKKQIASPWVRTSALASEG